MNIKLKKKNKELTKINSYLKRKYIYLKNNLNPLSTKDESKSKTNSGKKLNISRNLKYAMYSIHLLPGKICQIIGLKDLYELNNIVNVLSQFYYVYH